MPLVTQASRTVRQTSGLDPDSRNILSVLAKRTYHIERSGRCVLANEQVSLKMEPEADPAFPDLLAHDMDVFPIKLATDVVVKGHVYGGLAARTLEASVQIGRFRKALLAIGDRRCLLSATGRIVFSEPASFARIPTGYQVAYGGKDGVAETKHGNPFEELRKYLPKSIDVAQATPFAYPRNPCGVGYLIEPTPDAVGQLRLPNLEDPADRLTPERIVAGGAGRWPLMPLPQSFDWVHHTWFPRLAYFGFLPPHDPLDKPISEVVRGFAPSDVLKLAPQAEKFSFRFTSGASLGLQLPYLRGDEEILLVNMHPKYSRFAFRLPGERPRIWTDGRDGRLNATESVLHTLLIEPDASRLSVVWGGSAPAIRPYFAQELETMPLRVEW
jgi:hypothetical protein